MRYGIDFFKLVEHITLGTFAGLVSGAAAVLFHECIGFFHNLFFRGTLSFQLDELDFTPEAPWKWGVIFVPAVGALAVAFLIRHFAPRAHAFGMSAVIRAIYYRHSRLNFMLAPVKMIVSAISIGSGGSIGREGPIIQITAALGSTLGRIVRVRARERSLLLAAASAGGVAGAFDTPLSAVLIVAELMMPSLTAMTLLPVTISAVVSSIAATRIFGIGRLLPEVAIPEGAVGAAGEFAVLFPMLALLGVLAGLMGAGFILGVCRSEKLFSEKLPNYYLRHGSGMLLVGVELELFFVFTGRYYVDGLGYAFLGSLLDGGHYSILLLVALGAGKFLSTALTLGSGGSGGIVCPSLFLGAALGALVGRLFPSIPPEIPILAGMSAAVGSNTGAIATGILMSCELTGCYETMAPCAVASVIAWGVRQMLAGGGFYAYRLRRGSFPMPEGLQSAVWKTLRARDVMRPLNPEDLSDPQYASWGRIEGDLPLDEVLRRWGRGERICGFVVLDKTRPCGVLGEHELRKNCVEVADRML
ncbi:MAG: chloride channel protein [Victivallaceae bacterium]|nr:chloride channel protein [Victivallaceae bacterium]